MKPLSNKTAVFSRKRGFIQKYSLVSLAIITITLGIGFTLYFLKHPPLYTYYFKEEGLLFSIWHSEKYLNIRWNLAFIALFITAFSLLLFQLHERRTITVTQSNVAHWLQIFTPLGFLPLALLPYLFADIITPSLSTNLALFTLIGVLSLFLAKFFAPYLNSNSMKDGKAAIWAIGIFLVATIGYAWGGYHFSQTIGEHVGDEGHYLIQARSLYEDQNLDIKKQLLDSLGINEPDQVNRYHYHVAHESKGDAWYSWHPYGLSLLLAPIWKWGLGARHIMLGIISATGLAGLFLLCRRVGAGNVASTLTVASLGTGVFWGLYSFRALPETLGATLLIWIFWAVLAQKDKPWIALFVAAIFTVYLPFVHTRFVPLCPIGAGLFLLFSLLNRHEQRLLLLRLTIFFSIILTGASAYMGMQSTMFEGSSSYPISSLLFSYPLGAWSIIAGHRGLLSHTPLFFWVSGAMVFWYWSNKEQRLFIVGITATFLACLLTSGATKWYTGGSSVPARFLLVVYPLLLPATAIVLERVRFPAQFWFFALSLFSTIIMLLIFLYLPLIGRNFILPLHHLSSMPMLQDIFFPYASFEHGTSHQIRHTNFFVITTFLITLYIIFSKKNFFSLLAIIFITFIGLYANINVESGHFITIKKIQDLCIKNNNIVIIRHDGQSDKIWTDAIDVYHMHSLTGSRIINENERVRFAFQDEHQEGMMAFGRHRYVFPGEFNVFFELKTENCPSECLVATIDVASDSGKNILGSSDITCNNLQLGEIISFSVDRFLKIEPRLYYHGCGDVVLHQVYVQHAGAPK